MAFAYKEDLQRESDKVGKIAVMDAVNGGHISRRAVDKQSTTCIGFKRGADRRMPTGFQVGKVVSTIGKFDISQSVGTRDLNERFGPETDSGTKKEWPLRVLRVITDAIPISLNLMRVN
jgi:hypothetical protein